jgi:hypothetical protein
VRERRGRQDRWRRERTTTLLEHAAPNLAGLEERIGPPACARDRLRELLGRGRGSRPPAAPLELLNPLGFVDRSVGTAAPKCGEPRELAAMSSAEEDQGQAATTAAEALATA